MRVVALRTLVAADESLVSVVKLTIGEGLWRDAEPDSEWHPWRNRGEGTIHYSSIRSFGAWL